MTLGESAGRSAGNRPRASARRRFDEVERKENTPLLDDPDYWGEETRMNRLRVRFFDYAYGMMFGILAIVLIIISSYGGWLGELAIGLNVTLVSVLASIAYNRRRR